MPIAQKNESAKVKLKRKRKKRKKRKVVNPDIGVMSDNNLPIDPVQYMEEEYNGGMETHLPNI